MKKVVVIPIVVGTLGAITTKFEKYIESLGIEIRIAHVQKSALLETARIIRKVISCEVPRKGYCCETFDVCSHSKNQIYQNLSSVRDNIERNDKSPA